MKLFNNEANRQPPRHLKYLLCGMFDETRALSHVFCVSTKRACRTNAGSGTGERGSVGEERDKVTLEACGSGATLRKKLRNELWIHAGQMRGALEKQLRMFKKKRRKKKMKQRVLVMTICCLQTGMWIWFCIKRNISSVENYSSEHFESAERDSISSLGLFLPANN